MMTTSKALLTTLFVLGSSSVAMARPAVSVVDRTYQRTPRHETRPETRPMPLPHPQASAPVWNDGVLAPNNTSIGGDSSSYIGPIFAMRASYGGGYGSYPSYPSGGRFVTLTQPTRIDNGREFFTLGASAGAFTKIALRNTAGHTFVKQVAIEFVGGGRTQVVPVNQYLDGSFVIDLDGHNARTINRVVVYGSSGARSSYALMGA